MLLQSNPHDHTTNTSTDLFGAPINQDTDTPATRRSESGGRPQAEGEYRRTAIRAECAHCDDERRDACRAGVGTLPRRERARYQLMRDAELIYLCHTHAWRNGYKGAA